MEALPLLLCQFINPIDMELKHKELYQSPVTIVVELKFEGIICQSLPGAGVNDYTWNPSVIE